MTYLTPEDLRDWRILKKKYTAADKSFHFQPSPGIFGMLAIFANVSLCPRCVYAMSLWQSGGRSGRTSQVDFPVIVCCSEMQTKKASLFDFSRPRVTLIWRDRFIRESCRCKQSSRVCVCVRAFGAPALSLAEHSNLRVIHFSQIMTHTPSALCMLHTGTRSSQRLWCLHVDNSTRVPLFFFSPLAHLPLFLVSLLLFLLFLAVWIWHSLVPLKRTMQCL